MNSSTESQPAATARSTSEIDWSQATVIDPRIPLEDAIRTYIKKQEGADCVAYVEGFMVYSLTEFIQDAVAKFIAGQKEHGGDFREVDHRREAKAERTDSFWYGAGDDWNQRKP